MLNTDMFGVGLFRVGSLLGRLILLYLVTNYFSIKDASDYGIIAASIIYLGFVIGLNYHNYSVREIIKSPLSVRGRIIRDQLVFHLFTYLIFLPLFYYILRDRGGVSVYLNLLLLLLITEQINTEFYRILIGTGRQLQANLLLFIRSGLWVYILFFLFYVEFVEIGLYSALLAWMVASLLSIIIAIYMFSSQSFGGWFDKIEYNWIVKGVKVCLPLLSATLIFEALFFFDKYLLKALYSDEVLAYYTISFMICGFLITVVDAFVVSFLYPVLIDSAQRGEWSAYRENYKKLRRRVLWIVVFGAVFMYSLNIFLEVFDKDIYMKLIYLPEVYFAFSLLALNYVYHYSLYALSMDKELLISAIYGLITFFLLVFVFEIFKFNPSVIYAIIGALSVVCLTKSRFIRKTKIII
jgi:O-antigen/teichoic acid export membrane protein